MLVGVFAITMMAIPVISNSSVQNTNAQSQSATNQSSSVPPAGNSSNAQVGQLFTFNEKK